MSWSWHTELGIGTGILMKAPGVMLIRIVSCTGTRGASQVRVPSARSEVVLVEVCPLSSEPEDSARVDEGNRGGDGEAQ